MKSSRFFNVLLFVALYNCNFLIAQDKYLDKNGTITFEASEAAFEEVKATHSSVTAILNVENGQLAALALVKGFRFKNALMEEHFNENYIESETYPKATFKGKLIDFDVSQLSENPVEVKAEGTVSLHGKEKQITTDLNLSKKGDVIVLDGSFVTAPADFDIEIPKIVRNKIAKEVTVQFDFNLTKR